MASNVSTFAQLGVSRVGGSPLDLPRRAHALLAERFPLLRVRHKPLSILRQEGRRLLEQFFDAQMPPLPRPERDKLIEEVLGEAAGFGPLEELFRDETVKEVMVLTASQVIARKEAGWVPTSVRFRDPAHYRGYVRRLAETGEPLAGGGPGDAGFDVRIANGFRVVGVLPPDVLDQPPLTVFTRGDMPAPPAGSPNSSGTVSALSTSRTSAAVGSGTVSFSATARGPGASSSARYEPIPKPAPLPLPPPAPPTEFYAPAHLDPKERLRRRVSERIIRKCAAAGVYDLSVIPTGELQKVIFAHVEELNTSDRLNLSAQEMQIVTLEIFTGMRR